jgi:hypothetical protein
MARRGANNRELEVPPLEAPLLGQSFWNPDLQRVREDVRQMLVNQGQEIPDWLLHDRYEGVILQDGRKVGVNATFDDVPEPKTRPPLYKKRVIEAEKKEARERDKLYELYLIEPDVPLIEKVERLLLADLFDDDISELLKDPPYSLDKKTVDEYIETVRDKWKRIGSPLTTEEKELERGKAIARLRIMRNDMYTSTGIRNDPRLQNTIFQIDKEINELMGIDSLKAQTADAKESDVKFQQLIDNLEVDKLTDLIALLKEDPTTLESPKEDQSS